MSETRLRVPDMSCEGCVATVGRALEALPGVAAVDVDLDAKLVRVEHDRDRTATAQLRSAVEDQGYDVTGWDPQ
jgi:copper ion binding protein